MHQDPAQGVMTQSAFLVAAAVDALGEPDGSGVAALMGEFRRVLQQQHGSAACIISLTCREEMPAKNVSLFDLRIRQKPIGGFGARPVLAGKRDGASARP
jgi:hypothetical protein